MTINVYDITQYSFTSTDKILFDANVWLAINGPFVNPQSTRAKTYSKALKALKLARSTLFIDVVVISEFINRCLRLRYEQFKLNHPGIDFKSYRNTLAFASVANALSITSKNIIKTCTCIDSGFPRLDFDQLFTDFSRGGQDFNDQIIEKLCEKESLILVTHDSDFKNNNSYKLLTANQQLLSAITAQP